MPNFPFATVGFDLDGTLLDTARDLGEALNHALIGGGRKSVPLANVGNLIGGGARSMIVRALAQQGAAEQGGDADDEVDALLAVLLAHYTAHLANHTQPFPGAVAVLDELAALGVRLAVVTNKREALARRLFDALGLGNRFFTIIGGDTLGPGHLKPAPDLLVEMQRRGGPGRAAFVGDTTYDVRAAHAAGMPCVAVSFGYCDAPPGQLGADAVINDFAELVPALERL